MLKLARKKLGNQNAYFEANPYTIFLDGELKLVTMLCSYKKNKPVYTSVIFDYDFEKKSVKSTELYSGWIPKKVETAKKLPAEEADALVKSLYNDNSDGHNQMYFGSYQPTGTARYKRAQELGNKYGIKKVSHVMQQVIRKITLTSCCSNIIQALQSAFIQAGLKKHSRSRYMLTARIIL